MAHDHMTLAADSRGRFLPARLPQFFTTEIPQL